MSDLECFKESLISECKIHFGKQLLYRFDNSYGLSIIENDKTDLPKYNIATIKFDFGNDYYDVVYDTGISNIDVLTDKLEVISHLINSVKNIQ